MKDAEIHEMLRLLEETPRRIASLTAGLETTRLTVKTEAESWSVNDILAHLRACTDVWGRSIQVMIEQDKPTLRYISPRTHIRKTNYPEQGFRASFDAFTRQRQELLTRLRALDEAGWQRGAMFTGTTKGREETVYTYARRMALHEGGHCEQIEALLKS